MNFANKNTQNPLALFYKSNKFTDTINLFAQCGRPVCKMSTDCVYQSMLSYRYTNVSTHPKRTTRLTINEQKMTDKMPTLRKIKKDLQTDTTIWLIAIEKG